MNNVVQKKKLITTRKITKIVKYFYSFSFNYYSPVFNRFIHGK